MVATDDVWTTMRAGLAAFFRGRVRDPHLGEDLLQETFVRVHDGLPRLEDEARLGPWVYRVARSVLADHFRELRSEESADLASLPARDAAAQELERNFNREVDSWLRAMAEGLPDEYRAALELAEVEGLPLAEVARRLGLSLSGAKSRVQRGRQRLRALLLQCCHLDFDRRGNVVGYERHGACRGCSGS